MKKREQYDWIDDAFDENKQDPLANKGMTGGSSLVVLVVAVVIIGIICFAGFGLISAAGGFLSSDFS